MRPTAALFPAALLAAALFGNGTEVGNLFCYYCIIQLFSLCSVDAFRNAAAREPGVRRVDRRFSGTWIMIIFGIAACVIAEYCLGWDQNPILEIASVGCIIIEQLFEERMYALSHPSDGAILSVVAIVLLLAGLMIDSSEGMAAPVNLSGFYTLCGAGLGMLVSIIASYIIEPMHAFSLIPRNIGFFPKAAVQMLLYPLIMFLFKNTAANMAGLVIWRLSRTVCRRAQDESRPLNLLIIAICGILAVISVWIPELSAYAEMTALATIVVVLAFCAPGWRIYTGTALIAVANFLSSYRFLPKQWNMIAVILCCAAAIILNLHKAFLRKV